MWEETEDDLEDDHDEDEDDGTTAPCPGCGEPVYDDAERCPECGHYITRENRMGAQPRWVILGVVLALILAAAWIFR